MRQRSNVILEYGIYMLAYLVSYVLALAEHELFSGSVLIFAALYLYTRWYRETGNLVDLRGLFTLAWVGGQGIACLQLSRLQTNWHYLTWICFFLIYLGFGVGYEWGLKDGRIPQKVEKSTQYARRLGCCINGVGLLALGSFIVEVVIRGYIPLFSEVSHGYLHFPVPVFRNFVSGFMLLPALLILYIQSSEVLKRNHKAFIIIWSVCSLVVPILCVSRFQILLAAGVALAVYVVTNKRIKGWMILVILLVLVPLYVFLTMARNHGVSYLNSVFEMRYPNMPIFITQPYMYVANNFENFNALVVGVGKHSFGLRMLYPLFALSGLVAVLPKVTGMPLYLTKPELTTRTMFYDAYYDFGIFGALALAVASGVVAKKIVIKVRNSDNPVIFLLYGQIALYLGLAFFGTWFSDPSVWIWFAFTGICYWYVGKGKQKEEE